MFGWSKPPSNFSSLISTSTRSVHHSKPRAGNLLVVSCPRNSDIAILLPLNLPMKTSLNPPLPIFSNFCSLSGGISRSSKPSVPRSNSSSGSWDTCGVRGSSVWTRSERRRMGEETVSELLSLRRRRLMVDGGRMVPEEDLDEIACLSRHWRSASAS